MNYIIKSKLNTLKQSSPKILRVTLFLQFLLIHSTYAQTCSVQNSPQNIGSNQFSVGGSLLTTSNGNVGVNTSNPSARLEVVGRGWDSSTSAVRIYDSAGTSLLHISNSGSVEISNTNKLSSSIRFDNNTTINSNLTVNGTTELVGMVRLTGTADIKLNTHVGVGATPDPLAELLIRGQGTGSENFAMSILNSSGQGLIAIQNDGKVGIGFTPFSLNSFGGLTRNPLTETLDINGTLVIRGKYIQLTPQASPPDGCTNERIGAFALTKKYALCVCVIPVAQRNGKWVKYENADEDCPWI